MTLRAALNYRGGRQEAKNVLWVYEVAKRGNNIGGTFLPIWKEIVVTPDKLP